MKKLNEVTKNKYCYKFFSFFEVSTDGSCWICCPAWLPEKIGNILTDDFNTIWNGEKAQKLRNQVFTGDWCYCDHNICPLIASNSLPSLDDVDNDYLLSDYLKDAIKNNKVILEEMPTSIHFSEDRSCNLFCPSCRVEKILLKKGTEEYIKKKKINDKIFDLFLKTPTERKFEIYVTGSGDPFASTIYREMLENINGYDFPNLRINLNTNGVMFTPKNWNKLEKIHNNLQNCRISFDAGTKETYENKTRLGGNWDLLLENCRYLNERSKEFSNFNIHFDFVVQKDNYKEMKTYAELILDNFDNAESIHFSKLNDWGTWDKQQFNEHAVWKEENSEFESFINTLKDDIFDHPKIYLGNISRFKYG